MTGSGIRYEAELNEQQLAAVTAPDGAALVIAAAGTGKTRTLTYRVAWLVDHEVDADRILLLTFTNRAAREMLDRAQQLVGERVGGLWGGTFHHMANRLLRRHADCLGYGHDYSILDQDDSVSLVKACLRDLPGGGKDLPKADVLLSLFSLAANTSKPLTYILPQRLGKYMGSEEAVLQVHRAYEKRKRAQNGMDFDDLLVNGLLLFREHPQVLESYQRRFRYVLVDEYQDTNVIQAAWVDAVSSLHGNLMVVGDDFQSIYSWRGADFRNILSFPERHNGTSVYKLEINYRSVPEILRVANRCIAGNPEQFQKELQPQREPYRKPWLFRVHDGGEQSACVVERIEALRREGYRLDEIAVLYRAHYQAMELQLLLTRSGIPFLLTSGLRFFEQAHVKDVASLVRLVANPSDELAFARLMGLLPRVGPKTAAKIWTGLGGRFPSPTPEALPMLRKAMPADAAKKWEPVEDVLLSLGIEACRTQPHELIERFIAAFYEEYAAKTYENFENRVEDLNELARFAARFEDTHSFLSELALLTNLDADRRREEVESEDRIRLSTVHQAKGLEWKVVFVLWMTDGMFPSARSLLDDSGEAEERRLFYVATTRAKDELYFLAPQMNRGRDGAPQYHSLSRFISELPKDLLQRGDYSAW